MEEFDHLKIQLKDIILATHNFLPSKLIGRGGFGSVYKGELSRPEGLITVACKRLDPKFGQGGVEFLKEILMLFKYKHENLISLLHFCTEHNEKILVYKYASRGSLDRYLSDPSLTWTQRLRICVGVARALNYLHDPADTHQRIIHRDIKSSNILLDEEWNAKVSDFGLSKFGPANQPQTYLVPNAVGTPGYGDPLYWKDGILSKESDVYSFGVVLFEVMCGRLCCEYRDGSLKDVLVSKWEKCFEEKKLDDIVFHGLKEHMEPDSLNTTFSTIAYQCLKTARKERPTMAKIVEELKIALEQHEVFEDIGKRMNFEELRRIADLAESPISYITRSQLLKVFMKGMLVDDGKTWISVNSKGQHCELISAQRCIPPDFTFSASNTNLVSRFQYLFTYDSYVDLRLSIMTQFLTPNVTYIINLIYKLSGYDSDQYGLCVPFKYKLEEMRDYWTSCVAHVGEDGWLRTELFQFTSTKKKQNFDIHFLSDMKGWLYPIFRLDIEGVEFCPADFDKDEHKVEHMQATDIDWEESLANDYTHIVKWLKDIQESMTKKDVYFLLRKGIYINDSQQWFSITKKSNNRLMLPARAILPEEKSSWNILSGRNWLWKSLPGSRFNEVAESGNKNRLAISVQIESQLLSADTKYACYLVFKLPQNASVFEGIVKTKFKKRSWLDTSKRHYIYLLTPSHTPVVVLSPGERPSRAHRIKGHTKLRKDGWMEIPVWEFQLGSNSGSFWLDGYLKSLDKWNFTGLLIQGIEFRPAKVFKPVFM